MMPRLDTTFLEYRELSRLLKFPGLRRRGRKTCVAVGTAAVLLFSISEAAIALGETSVD